MQTYRILGLAMVIIGAVLSLLGSEIIGGTAFSGTGWLIVGVILVVGGLAVGRWVRGQSPPRG